jgi:DNA-directed RNA polymerase specialized sigma24 family protein
MRLTEEQQKKAEDYWLLAKSYAIKFSREHPHLRDEAISSAMEVLCRCVRTFRGDRGTFGQYLFSAIRYDSYLVTMPQGLKRQGKTVSFDNFSSLLVDSSFENRVSAKIDCDKILRNSPEKSKKAIINRYIHDMEYREACLAAGKDLGLSTGNNGRDQMTFMAASFVRQHIETLRRRAHKQTLKEAAYEN